MKAALADADATSLVNVAFGSAMEGLDGTNELNERSPRTAMIEAIRVAAAAVKAKIPGEASRFAHTLNTLAQKVAEASKEGSFLGIGAKVISADEQRALDKIRAALA